MTNLAAGDTSVGSTPTREGPTAGGLSRVVQLRGSDPMHHSGAHPKSDRLPTGITDRFAPDSVIGLLRNTQSVRSISKLLPWRGLISRTEKGHDISA